MLNYFLYTRKSTDVEDKQILSIEAQLAELRALAKHEGLSITDEFIEKMSMDALAQFPDNSLDFVYLDGNHQDPYIAQDINEWMKKVKPGGILAGHDYAHIKRVKWGVKEAVEKYAKENKLKLFILGLDATTDYLVRDGSRSWMFIKT